MCNIPCIKWKSKHKVLKKTHNPTNCLTDTYFFVLCCMFRRLAVTARLAVELKWNEKHDQKLSLCLYNLQFMCTILHLSVTYRKTISTHTHFFVVLFPQRRLVVTARLVVKLTRQVVENTRLAVKLKWNRKHD